jgi:hypothetical protein
MVRILFACERFREGSDVKGLEMTAVLTGNTIAAYILLQISGRALRNDYEGKEGWSLIARPSEEGTTEDDVYDSFLIHILDFLSKNSKKYEPKEIERLLRSYIDVNRIGKGSSVEETIKRLQAVYVRRESASRTPKEKYSLIKQLNKEMKLTSKNEYEAAKETHLNYISDPKMYFREQWTCWYDFLGVDTSLFPQTKAEWIRLCKDVGITSWELYKIKNIATLPDNPSEVYEAYTNWDKELGVEDEIVW